MDNRAGYWNYDSWFGRKRYYSHAHLDYVNKRKRHHYTHYDDYIDTHQYKRQLTDKEWINNQRYLDMINQREGHYHPTGGHSGGGGRPRSRALYYKTYGRNYRKSWYTNYK